MKSHAYSAVVFFTLVAVASAQWQNPSDPLDVDGDGSVLTLDALVVINQLNGNGPTYLPSTSMIPPPYLDTTGDLYVTVNDALLVINHLNGGSSPAGPEPIKASIRLQAVDDDGNAISTVSVGSTFQLQVYVRDLRLTDPEGVFAAYTDITYDSSMSSATEPITYGAPYSNGVSGDLSVLGLVNEAGAFDGLSPLGPTERLLLSIPFTATSVGLATFTPDPADDEGYEVLLYERDELVSPEEVLYIPTVLTIVPEPSAALLVLTALPGLYIARRRRQIGKAPSASAAA